MSDSTTAGSSKDPPSNESDLVETVAGERSDTGGERELETGSALGRYVLLERVGLGGMGLVFAAYDPELQRRVALKVLRPDRTEAGGVGAARARLLLEAQAMARLSHPNVIAVYDVGTVDERVFVAMEFVEGDTLAKWLASEHRTWKKVLDVFVRAGNGLAAAHAAGLVHRDFKPENVLVGSDGRVRVMDFGLARAAAGSEDAETADLTTSDGFDQPLAQGLTVAGVVMGTPAYMAPEQHAGRPTDARSDQFAFCVALYEALYGERPFAGSNAEELGRNKFKGNIKDAPADSRVPAWVRRTVLRGLTAEAAERWPGMEAVLTELAKDPAAVRRKWLVVGGMVTLVGGSVAGVEYMRAQREAVCEGAEQHLSTVWDGDVKAAVERALAGTKVPYAEAAWPQVEAQLDRYAAAWSEMHEEACAATHLRGEQSAELLDLRMRCLNERRAELAALASVMSDADAEVARNAVSASADLSTLQACADVEALLSQVDRPRDLATIEAAELLREQLARARALEHAGKFGDALAVAEEASAAAQSIDEPMVRAEAQFLVGDLQERVGDYEKAEQNIQEALWAAAGAKHDKVAAEAATSLVYVVGYRLSRPSEGLHWGRHAEAAVRRVGAGGPAEARLLMNLGSVLVQQGRYDEARERELRALAIWEQSTGAERLNVARSLSNLGSVLEAQGAYAEAQKHHERGLEIRQELLGGAHPEVAMSLNNLGTVLHRQGQDATARENLERALKIWEEALGDNHLDVANALNNLGAVLEVTGDLEQAGKYHARALEIFERIEGPHGPKVGASLANLGLVLVRRGQFSEARDRLEQAVGAIEKSYGYRHPHLGHALNSLGKAYLGLDEPATAVERLDRGLELCNASECEPFVVAQLKFTLARALRVTDADSQRAAELATEARKGLVSLGDAHAAEVREIDAWLAASPTGEL